jgi:hypothetical protein
VSSKRKELPIFNTRDPNQYARLVRHVTSLKPDIYRIEITRIRDQRSGSQNAYYWAVVLPHVAFAMREVSGEQEIDAYDVHEFFKARLLTRHIPNLETGESIAVVTRSTAELNIEEFADYLNKIILWAAEYCNHEIPPANKIYDDPEGRELPPADAKPPTRTRVKVKRRDQPEEVDEDTADRRIESQLNTPRKLE